MRFPASEKLEIIRLVEESALPVRRTLKGWHSARHLLPLVRSVPGRWAGSPGRPSRRGLTHRHRQSKFPQAQAQGLGKAKKAVIENGTGR
jgi:hypothetical protein